MKISIFGIISYIICTLLLIYAAFTYVPPENELITVLALTAISVVLFMSAIFFKYKNIAAFRSCFLVVVIGGVIVIIYRIFQLLGIAEHFASVAAIKDFVLSSGGFGAIVYVLISFIQVTFIPIPAMITILAGVAIYGPFWASILSLIGIILGAIAAFFMGRIFGFKLIKWAAGDENAHKYARMLNKKGKFLLIGMFLLPIFPDDLLCLVAGTTEMSFMFFLITNLVTRPFGIFPTAYFMGGSIIPFSGWGLFVWPFIVVILGVSLILFYKYQEKIQKWIYKILKIKK